MKVEEYKILLSAIIAVNIVLALLAAVNGLEIRALWCVLSAVIAFQCWLTYKITLLEGRK